jgi:hypothetical protein
MREEDRLVHLRDDRILGGALFCLGTQRNHCLDRSKTGHYRILRLGMERDGGHVDRGDRDGAPAAVACGRALGGVRVDREEDAPLVQLAVRRVGVKECQRARPPG